MKNLPKNIVLGILGIIAIFAIIYFLNDQKDVQTKLPAPFDKFDYLYSVRENKKGSGEGVSFYRNSTELKKSLNISNGVLAYKPLMDGKGFYELKYTGDGKTIPCGNKQLDPSTGIVASNATCITHNGNDYAAVDWPDYTDSSIVVYQQCEKVKFYTRDELNAPGQNQCQKFLLKVNDKTIDSSSEYYSSLIDSNKNFLTGAAKFESIKVQDGKLTYLKLDPEKEESVFVTYDITSGTRNEIKDYMGKSIAYAELVNSIPAFLVWNNDLSKDFYYQNQKVSNVDAFSHLKNDFFFVKPDPKNKGISRGISLLKGDVGLRHFEGNFFNVSSDMIGVYPNCGFDSLVCLFDGQNFAAQSSKVDYKEPVYINSTLLPEDVYRKNIKDFFVFSQDGNTYVVYAQLNKILAQNIDTAEKVTLFEFNESSNIDDLKVFDKSI